MSLKRKTKTYKIKVRLIDSSEEMIVCKIKKRGLINPFIKLVAFVLIIVLNWAGLSAVYQTIAYMNDTENSADNNFVAGTLDFELSSTQVFSNLGLSPGESVTGTISVINLSNTPKYKVKSVDFSGLLCDYLNLEANLDGDGVEYSGRLIDFDFGPTVFEEPDDWFFTLLLPADASEDTIGETCDFDFLFYGSQIKNDLPFGQGFSDEEGANNNVKSQICYDAETRSKGYWKNHSEVFVPYLPQMLGDENVDTVSEAVQILNYDNNSSSMRNKLRGQLLAMKFNIAHFSVGEYFVATTSQTINQIITDADNLLRQFPEPSKEILEAMKDLLDGLNQDLRFRACSGSLVKVIIPNGGETWWVGQYYDLTWTTKNLVCPNDSIVSIWYSKDSGATWGNIATSTENDGIYNWRTSLFLEGGTYYVPSHNARIKIVARCFENNMVAGWDMSDFDFCPPIDYSLLTEEEKTQVEQLLADGILTEADIINREITNLEEVPEDLELEAGENTTSTEEATTTIEEIATTTEAVSTTTEEISTTIEIITETSGETTEDVVEDTASETDESVVEEISEEEVPAEEEQPITLSEDSANQEGGDDGGGATETGGESTGDSGDAGETGETISE